MEAKPVGELLKKKKIYQIINPKLVRGGKDLSVQRAIEIMQENRSGYVVIEDGSKPVGIFTEVDVVRKVLGKKIDMNRPVTEFMTKDPMVLNPKDSVGDAIRVMGTNRFYHIPLVDDHGKLVNVISVRTLIRFLAEFYPTEIFNLPPVSDQVMESREGG